MISMLVVFGCVLALDQVSKAIVVARLPEGATSRASIAGVRLRHMVNRQHCWGLGRTVLTMAVLWMLLVTAALTVATLLHLPWLHLVLGASIGGATGNLIDGIRRRGITDFIDLRVWPVFNVADLAIVAGALLTAWKLCHLP